MHISPALYRQYLKERERRGFTGCTAIAQTHASYEANDRGKNPAYIKKEKG